MALAARLCLCMLCITCTVLLMSSSTCGQETLYYDEALLRKYVFAAQQLRHQIKRLADSILSTVSEQNADVIEAEDELVARKADAATLAEGIMKRVVNVTSYMKMNFAPMIRVSGSPTYTSTSDYIFTVLEANHGMQFNPATSEIVVPMSGVYVVEYKLQAQYYFSMDLTIIDPEGNTIRTASRQFVYGCTPAVYVFELDGGSTIKMSNIKPFSSYYYVYPNYIIPGWKNQLQVRYLGPKD